MHCIETSKYVWTKYNVSNLDTDEIKYFQDRKNRYYNLQSETQIIEA